MRTKIYKKKNYFCNMKKIRKLCYLERVLMYIGFHIILLFGIVNSFFFSPKIGSKLNKTKYRGFINKYEEIYFNYVYRRVSDCSHTPVSSSIKTNIVINNRVTDDYGWTFRDTNERKECINFGSFDYMGFNEIVQDQFSELSSIIEKYGITTCSSHLDCGITPLHIQLEKLTAEFVGMEDAISYCTGFSTNVSNLPVILSEECLVLSDEKNHASLISGMRMSKAKIIKYSHMDLEDLEGKIIKNLHANRLKNNKLFSKMLIITESIYSMDGTIIDLPKIIELKKKYNAYLYIDDAHGVGILGDNSRGIIDFHNANSADVDLLMGTYSKAFASNGGFIAGKKVLIDYLRKNSFACYGPTMPPVIVQKTILSMQTIMNNSQLGNKLRIRARYLRTQLKEIGLNISGHDDSHIIPWVLGSISAVTLVVRELKKRNIAVAGVIYPATPLLASRIRINVSVGHTKQDLDQIIKEIKALSIQYGL